MKTNADCPCGSGNAYSACCGLYLDQGYLPDTAQALMRSRYVAYALKREDHLLHTWHRSTRPEKLNLDRDTAVKWLGLKIIRTEAGGLQDTEGLVEFVARYKVGGTAHRIHEASRFVREDGQWFYLDGQVTPAKSSR